MPQLGWLASCWSRRKGRFGPPNPDGPGTARTLPAGASRQQAGESGLGVGWQMQKFVLKINGVLASKAKVRVQGHSHKTGRLDRAMPVPFASRTRAATVRRQVPPRTRMRTSRGAAAMRGHGRRRQTERSCRSSRVAAGGIAGSTLGGPVARSTRHRRRGSSPCARAGPSTTRPLPPRARAPEEGRQRGGRSV